MKRYQPGGLVDSEGNPVRDGSGQPIMTGYGREEAETEARMEAARNKLAGEVQEMVKAKPSAAAQPNKASDGDVDERDRRMEAAASAPSRMPTRPGQSSSGRMMGAAPKAKQTPKAKDTSMDSAIMAGEVRKRQKPASAVMVDESRKRQNAQPRVMNDEARKRLPGKRKAEFEAWSKKMEKEQALERVTPEEYLLPGASLKALHKQAAKLAKPKIREYNPTTLPAPKAAAKAETKSLPAPQKKLSYDKGSVKAGERTRRAEGRNTQMQKDNDARYGVDTASKGYNPNRSRTGESRFNIGRGETKKSSTEVMDVTPKSTTPKPAPKKRIPRLMSEKKAKAATIGLGAAGAGTAVGTYAEKMVRQKRDRDSEVGMKKGGRVTASSASKRADGCAQRGKTRGKVY